MLVEAKAHLSELKEEGKTLASDASTQSHSNHAQIAECIAEASQALNDTLPGTVDLTIDSHYQLANRIASAWKPASCGLPKPEATGLHTGERVLSEGMHISPSLKA